MAGLSPEEINRAVATNIGGSKLLQDSVQNIFENNQKQAYADYLDRLPQDKLPKDPNAKLVEGGDGFYWEHNPVTGAIRRTDIPVAKKKLEYGTGGGMPFQFIPGEGGTWIRGDRKGGGMEQVNPPPGKNLPPSADQTRKDVKLTAEEAAELERTQAILNGNFKGKNKQTIKFNSEHATRFNQLSSGSEAAFVKEVPSRVFGIKEPTIVRKPIPGGLPVREAYKQYQFFTKEGGRGSFEDFIANPDVMAQVAAAMRK